MRVAGALGMASTEGPAVTGDDNTTDAWVGLADANGLRSER
jgi:hypothetical protein